MAKLASGHVAKVRFCLCKSNRILLPNTKYSLEFVRLVPIYVTHDTVDLGVCVSVLESIYQSIEGRKWEEEKLKIPFDVDYGCGRINTLLKWIS